MNLNHSIFSIGLAISITLWFIKFFHLRTYNLMLNSDTTFVSFTLWINFLFFISRSSFNSFLSLFVIFLNALLLHLQFSLLRFILSLSVRCCSILWTLLLRHFSHLLLLSWLWLLYIFCLNSLQILFIS